MNSGGGRIRSRAMENISLELDKYPRDLLQRFMSDETQQSRIKEEDDEEGIELSLGLSLGGRFGVDNTPKKLMRSSSIAGTIPLIREQEHALTSPPPVLQRQASLMRTSSLPVETEETWKKRKEMQSLRRMEAKRRRSEKEKQRKVNAAAEEEVLSRSRSGFAMSCSSAAGGRQPSGRGGSIESHCGGSSSGFSEFESRPFQGSGSCSEVRSSQDAVDSSGTRNEKLPRRTESVENRGMEEMPHVFTIGDGPEGRKIEGILYKYGKREDLRIMCVCHGEFHSPAEFVKHAGGGVVDHPLRHIVVNPSSPFL